MPHFAAALHRSHGVVSAHDRSEKLLGFDPTVFLLEWTAALLRRFERHHVWAGSAVEDEDSVGTSEIREAREAAGKMGELSKDRLWYALMSPNPSDRGAAAVQVVERATKKKGAGCSADGLLMASEVTKE